MKHYSDGSLRRGRRNDLELDARLVLEVFDGQQRAFHQADPDLITAWHWPTSANGGVGFDKIFEHVHRPGPPDAEAYIAIERRLARASRWAQTLAAMEDAGPHPRELAYALARLSVAGGDSVMPP